MLYAQNIKYVRCALERVRGSIKLANFSILKFEDELI
jgi:hypothetical protein